MKAKFLREHLEKIAVFRAVVEAASISKAASVIGLSQSTVSHTISKLEDVLDLSLLERKRKGVEITPQGELIYEFSKKLDAEILALEARIHNPREQNAGHLKIATHETLAIHVWPEFIEVLQRKYPNLHISLTSGRVDSIMLGILNRSIDLGVTVKPQTNEHIVQNKIYSGIFGFYAGLKKNCGKYNLLKKDVLGMQSIKNIPIVTDINAHIQQGLSIPRYLQTIGLTPPGTFEVTSFEAALRLASNGLAIAVVPKQNALEAIKMKLVREIKIREIPNRKFGEYSIHTSSLKNSYSENLVKLTTKELQEFFKNKMG